MGKKKLKIFISSPGDVGHERVTAIRVIEKLQGEFMDYVELEPILWEFEPLRATAHFQEQIVYPSSTDIVICILWARLGTKLPKSFKKDDGSDYSSGTEWEFEDAVKANRTKGIPDILVYKKTIEPIVKEKNRTFFSGEQKKALNSFLDKWFGNPENDFNVGLYSFEEIDEFEDDLEGQLRELIKEKIPEYIGEDKLPITWYKGSPYRGLQYFDESYSKIFYGRAKDIGKIKDAFLFQETTGCNFVMVFGSSGCGKSSLARAGVLPVITQYGVIDGIDVWIKVIITPGESPKDLIHGLLYKLGEDFLKLEPDFKSDLNKGLKRLKDVLELKAYEEKDKNNYTRIPKIKIFIVIDQMEELFTNLHITTQHRDSFVSFLHSLCCSGDVWILANMRSDFYCKVTEISELMEMKKETGQYDLMPLGISEIRQIIINPAKAAGLLFEAESGTGNSLYDVIQEEASKNNNSLPLLEFTLNELYKRKTDNNVLTFSYYREIGGINGAISTVAEGVLASLPKEVSVQLPTVFRDLVSVNPYAENGISSKRAQERILCNTAEKRKLVEAFIDARLLVADKDNEGNRVILVAHEALLTHWNRIRELIEEDKNFLKTREELLFSMYQWTVEDKKEDFLIPLGKQLNLAAKILQSRREDLNEELINYIEISKSRGRKKRRKTIGILLFASIFLIVFSIIGFNQWKKAVSQNEEAKMTESRKLTSLAQEQLKKENRLGAMKNSLLALPKNIDKPDKPFLKEGEDVLYNSMFMPSENSYIRGLLTTNSSITDYTFNNKGDELLVSCSDGTIALYSTKSLDKIKEFVLGNNLIAYGAVFSKDDSKIIVAVKNSNLAMDNSENIIIFNATSLEKIKEIPTEKMDINMAILEGDSFLYADSRLKGAKGIFLLDINKGDYINCTNPFDTSSNIFTTTICMNEKYIAAAFKLPSNPVGGLVIYDRSNGKQLKSYSFQFVVNASQFIEENKLRVLYSDGRIFDLDISAEELKEDLYLDLGVRDAFEVKSNKDMSKVSVVGSNGIFIGDVKDKRLIYKEDYNDVKNSTLTPDGKYFIIITKKNGMKFILNLEKMSLVDPKGIDNTLNEDGEYDCGLRYNMNGQYFINKIDDKVLQLIQDDEKIGQNLPIKVNRLTTQFSYTNRYIVDILKGDLIGDKLVIIDTKNKNQKKALFLPKDSSIEISTNKNYCYVTTNNNEIWVIDLETGSVLNILKGRYILAEGHKNGIIAVSIDDENIAFYDLNNKKEYRIKIDFIKGDFIDGSTFDYNDTTFAMQISRKDEENFEVQLWDYKNELCKNSFFTKEISKEESMDSFAFSLDGKMISIGTNFSERRLLYDVNTSEVIEESKEPFNHVYYKNDKEGEMFLRWGGLLNKKNNGFEITKVFYESIKSKGNIRDFFVSPSKTKLVVLYDDSSLVVYDLSEEKEIRKIYSVPNLVNVAFSDNEDSLIVIFDTESGSKIQELPFLSSQEIIDKARSEIYQ
ncbi:hypothetical protein [Clostridium sp.]|uniref:nSTAND1 domain-containing NTPase n=1 Tax=Clostridium sp. TaxID=1506 RepID=UPI002624B8CF|nr:hypothetical protein [Clostridium sp.]